MNHQHHDFDVCVVGGGLAGMCAAIASSRRGAKTVLVHDRPVLGGNSSSEVRMWVCGAHGANNQETGVLEEVQLENMHRNPTGNYSVWDSVLYEKCAFQPNLTLLLNCSVVDGEAEGPADERRIVKARAWQLTSQTWHHIGAKLFIDCSGDSILAPIAGAQTRWGREAREEFGEDIEPAEADRKTMGNTLLIQLRKTEQPQPFTPPAWAYRFDSPDDLSDRIKGVQAQNFWWIELGGLQDTIADAEPIRDELYKAAWGVWDYIKNRAPEKQEAETWALDWLGALPGKRENRRYVGLHTMTQHDVRGDGTFDDIVAYGGWSMDDHHPAGLLYPGKPTLFHAAPSPY
ncbi:MAG: FAD-dependent oxidoreductase, partial [Planctomycetota bacterium]